MINVTKSFMPPYEEYEAYLKKIWESGYLTNQGPCVQELEKKLKEYLNVPYFHYINNGTIALQLAIHALGITEGEIITTPFSFVATTTSILWENCKPVFVDIDPETLEIDPSKIEEKITDKTKAIMAVHVFGYPCDVKKIKEIADKHNIAVIYDAAHAFGTEYEGQSLLSYGDVSTCSFHATKVYHTVEGGACITNDPTVNEKLELMKKFGFVGENYQEVGINAKSSEFHAAMGLANYPYIEQVIARRKEISELYDALLEGQLQRPKVVENLKYNYAYYPVLFKDEAELLSVFDALHEEEVYPRRYFYPTLNELPYLEQYDACPNSEDISRRIACLPLYPDLENDSVTEICKVIRKTIKR